MRPPARSYVCFSLILAACESPLVVGKQDGGHHRLDGRVRTPDGPRTRLDAGSGRHDAMTPAPDAPPDGSATHDAHPDLPPDMGCNDASTAPECGYCVPGHHESCALGLACRARDSRCSEAPDDLCRRCGASSARSDGGPDGGRTDAGPPVSCMPDEVCAPRSGRPADSAFYCLLMCDYRADHETCPAGFQCTTSGACEPVAPTGCCFDPDGDRYGVGATCAGPDCPHAAGDPAIHPGADDRCGDGVDSDCNPATGSCPMPGCRADDGVHYRTWPASTCVSDVCTAGGMPAAPASCGGYKCNADGTVCAMTCAVSSDCEDAYFCDASHHCVADNADGGACSADGDCVSAHCSDGFCCATGDCCGTDAGICPAAYTIPSVCVDPAHCQGRRFDRICGVDHRCASAPVDDDTACGSSVTVDDCGPFPAVTCPGGADQTAPACATACAGDGECDADAYCAAGGACALDQSDGSPCTGDGGCTSGHCANGFCCRPGAADCCASAADCPAAYTIAPACTYPATCQGTRADATCAGSVCGSAFSDDDSGCVAPIDTCGAFRDIACNGAPAQTAPACATTCVDDTACDDGAHCDSVTSVCAP